MRQKRPNPRLFPKRPVRVSLSVDFPWPALLIPRKMIARTATPRSAFAQRASIWRSVAWLKRFHDPIILPDGRRQLKLRDAAEYIALPKAERGAADWQVAMEGLLLVAERDGPEILVRIAVMKALNQHGEPTPKEPKVKGASADFPPKNETSDNRRSMRPQAASPVSLVHGGVVPRIISPSSRRVGGRRHRSRRGTELSLDWPLLGRPS